MINNGQITRIGGMEFATFRLQAGVTEAMLLSMAARVEAEFLPSQSELIMHFLLRGADGVYAEVAIASSQDIAEQYCRQWLDNPVALQYLQLLDPQSVNMSFWQRIL